MRPFGLVAVVIVCIGNGCAWQQLFTQPTPPSLEEQLDDLVRTINDDPNILHADYTPSVSKLIKVGEPVIPRMLDLMLSEDEDTRLHAQRVLEGITLQQHGFVIGQGWPSGDSHNEEARFRAFWKSLGSLHWESPAPDREHAVKLWRAWVARNKA